MYFQLTCLCMSNQSLSFLRYGVLWSHKCFSAYGNAHWFMCYNSVLLLFTICWSFVLNVMLILCTETSVRSFKVRPAVTGAKPQPLQEIKQCKSCICKLGKMRIHCCGANFHVGLLQMWHLQTYVHLTFLLTIQTTPKNVHFTLC